jgi:drug/metabolite transporter (DMT)-like permease
MSNRFINWTIFILLCFIWGSSFVVMKIGREALTTTQVAALRIFSASVVFIPFAIYYITKLPARRLPLIIVTALFGNLFPAFLFVAAVAKMDSSLVGILNSLTPICVVVTGSILFRDRISGQKIAGVVIGFAGLCLLTLLREEISLANLGYASLVILATLSYGLNVNLVSHYLKDVHPVQLTAVSLAFMSIPTGAILWWTGFFRLDFSDPAIMESSIAVTLLGLVSSAFATVIFYILVQKAGGLFASLVTYGIPFVALFLGFIKYKEAVTWKEIGCLGIILGGVYLANKKK